MRPLPATVLGAVSLALGSAGAPAAQAESPVVWLSVCGQPGMRVALPLEGEDESPPGDENCVQACHALLCRKADTAPGLAGAKGARV